MIVSDHRSVLLQPHAYLTWWDLRAVRGEEGQFLSQMGFCRASLLA